LQDIATKQTNLSNSLYLSPWQLHYITLPCPVSQLSVLLQQYISQSTL